MTETPLHLFDAYGIEMEYMLVDRDTLSIRPVADTLLAILSGGRMASDFESGPISWSNELALHVLELKTTLPVRSVRSLPSQFETAIRDLRPVLDRLNVRLMPTAMHPWMNPKVETIIWPHENYEIYHAYDRIFNCKSHGWANVQSVHLNLPFCGDDEFGKLHAAVRMVLPILPALTASSPVVEGKVTGQASSRFRFYADHCRAVPSLTGDLIPEPIFDETAYRQQVFEPIRSDIAPLNTNGVLKVDFLNARGAIARFDRGSVELRVMDVQECPGADVAICAAVTAVVKSLVEESWSTLETQQNMPTAVLRSILDDTASKAENTVISNPDYLKALGIHQTSCTAGKLWSILLERVRKSDSSLDNQDAPIEIIQQYGTLATRICRALGETFTPEDLHSVYDEVSDCLNTWEPFQP